MIDGSDFLLCSYILAAATVTMGFLGTALLTLASYKVDKDLKIMVTTLCLSLIVTTWIIFDQQVDLLREELRTNESYQNNH